MTIVHRLTDALNAGDNQIAPENSEEALALDFARRHADKLRYVAIWNWWFIYDGTCWRVDEKRKVFSLARELCREEANSINKAHERRRVASAKTRAAVVSLAGEDRRLAATKDQWDVNPWLLNTPGGTVDLCTGQMREHRPTDYITKITIATPDPACQTPLWTAFLAKVTRDDDEFQKYLARVSGYSLTGTTKEHALFFLFGEGGNGKTTYVKTTSDIMGDYHCTAPIETFVETNSDRHPTELAMLRGSRLVTSTETEEGRYWAEKKITAITGGEKITARFMKQDFFTYLPEFKLMIAGNHKPSLRTVNEAIRRRVNLLPFMVKIEEAEKDKELPNKLMAEWPGILSWMIDGCLAWQSGKGLKHPVVVTKATDEYLQAEDTIKLWLDECCRLEKDAWTSSKMLYAKWKSWAESYGEKVGNSKAFSQKLQSLGFARKRGGSNRDKGFEGLTVYEPVAEPQPAGQREIWREPF